MKRAKAAAFKKTPVGEITPDQQIVGAVFLGKVRRYSPRSGSIHLVIEAPLSIGDSVRIKGKDTDLTQPVEAMKVNGRKAQSAAPGEEIAISVADRVKTGDAVFKL